MHIQLPNTESATPEGVDAFDFHSFCSDPTIRKSGPVKIALFRGPIYSDDALWTVLLECHSDVVRYLAEAGLRLEINTTDGYAFARQTSDDEPGADWGKLFHTDRFTFDVTCVLVILREWLLSRETATGDAFVPLPVEDLVQDLTKHFSRRRNANADKEEKRWREAVNKVVDMGYLKRIPGQEAFIVRPIIRAKLSLDVLQHVKVALERHASGNNNNNSESS